MLCHAFQREPLLAFVDNIAEQAFAQPTASPLFPAQFLESLGEAERGEARVAYRVLSKVVAEALLNAVLRVRGPEAGFALNAVLGMIASAVSVGQDKKKRPAFVTEAALQFARSQLNAHLVQHPFHPRPFLVNLLEAQPPLMDLKDARGRLAAVCARFFEKRISRRLGDAGPRE